MHVVEGVVADVPETVAGGTTFRRAPPLYGVGLLEVIRETDLQKNLAVALRRGQDVRLARSAGLARRFGVLGTDASLETFTARALATELGITSSVARRLAHNRCPGNQLAPIDEIGPEDLGALVFYVRHLAPPPKSLEAGPLAHGKRLFAELGCAQCHRPTYEVQLASTGRRITISPYTDLLLHNTAPEKKREPSASQSYTTQATSYVRTAALWGVWATGPPYMHDGRADTLDEAITSHQGDGAAASAAYRALSERDKAELIRFLKAL